MTNDNVEVTTNKPNTITPEQMQRIINLQKQYAIKQSFRAFWQSGKARKLRLRNRYHGENPRGIVVEEKKAD